MDTSPFAKLPAETRNKIYELVIGTRPSKKPTNIGKACQVSIARVCKQMRAETLPMCFSNITARINVVSNFELPFNHKHEPAGLDHHWGACRASFLKGASNIMAVAQRISMHPQACYDGLARLNLRIILDAEDYGFGLAWQVWEPHLRELMSALSQRDVNGERLCVRVEYHTFSVEEKKMITEDLRMAFEGLGLRPNMISVLQDDDLMLEMGQLREEWRAMHAENDDSHPYRVLGASMTYWAWPRLERGKSKKERSRMVKTIVEKVSAQMSDDPYFDIPNMISSRPRRSEDEMHKEANDLRRKALARGEDIGVLEGHSMGILGQIGQSLESRDRMVRSGFHRTGSAMCCDVTGTRCSPAQRTRSNMARHSTSLVNGRTLGDADAPTMERRERKVATSRAEYTV